MQTVLLHHPAQARHKADELGGEQAEDEDGHRQGGEHHPLAAAKTQAVILGYGQPQFVYQVYAKKVAANKTAKTAQCLAAPRLQLLGCHKQRRRRGNDMKVQLLEKCLVGLLHPTLNPESSENRNQQSAQAEEIYPAALTFGKILHRQVVSQQEISGIAHHAVHCKNVVELKP